MNDQLSDRLNDRLSDRIDRLEDRLLDALEQLDARHAAERDRRQEGDQWLRDRVAALETEVERLSDRLYRVEP